MAIVPKTYPNILKYGLQAAYDAIAVKDSSVLYFCTDTKKLYKGDIDFTDSVVFAASKSVVTAPVVGKLYVFADTNTCEVYNGADWTIVSYPLVTAIDASSDDVHVPSAKAVYDFVEDQIAEVTGGSGIVTSIVSKEDNDGTLEYTTGDGNKHDVVMNGVVVNPEYDPATRKFTFPVTGGAALEVELGKDIFIDPTGDNSYHADTKEIWLTLNDGKEGTDPTVIKIPAAGLVNILTGATSNSATVKVDNAAGTITVDANIKADSVEVDKEFTNALKVDDGGMYVDLSAYATITYVDGEIATVTQAAQDAQDAADAAQATADQNAADIAALAAATTVWGTF